MKKTKLYFGVLVILLLGLLLYSIRFDYLDRINSDNFIDYAVPPSFEKVYSNCTPIFPEERTIILRLDDIGAGYRNIYTRLINDTLNKNISLVIAVIPNDVSRSRSISLYLRNLSKNSNIEVAQHGYMHTPREFENMTKNTAESIYLGQTALIKKLGIIPITFIPPYNTYSANLLPIISKYGFKIISSGQGNYRYWNGTFMLDMSATDYDYNKKSLIDPYQIIEDCNSSLKKTNLCVVMVHPQNYGQINHSFSLDNEKYENYLLMLDGLKSLNANFKTFKDLLNC